MSDMTEVKDARTQYVIHIENLTLAAGSASFENPFAGGDLDTVIISQKSSTPVAEGFGYAESSGTITIYSSNGTSTATVDVTCIGRY